MYRINGPGHVNNQFVEEDINNNRPPTQLTAKWFNDVQEEIINVIAAANITLNQNQQNQLLQALQAMFGTSSASEIAAGKVELATAAETLSGLDDTRAVHPKGLSYVLGFKAPVTNPFFFGDLRTAYSALINQAKILFGTNNSFLEFDSNNFKFSCLTGYLYVNNAVVATQNWVNDRITTYINNLIDGSTMSTLKQLSNSIGNDAGFANTVWNWVSARVDWTTFNSYRDLPYRNNNLYPSDNSSQLPHTGWLKYGLGYAYGENGYLKFPEWMGSIIVQWGTYVNTNAVDNNYYYFNYPIAFPNAVLMLVGSNADGNSAANTFATDAVKVNNWSGKVSWASTGTHRLNYIVIGY